VSVASVLAMSPANHKWLKEVFKQRPNHHLLAINFVQISNGSEKKQGDIFFGKF